MRQEAKLRQTNNELCKYTLHCVYKNCAVRTKGTIPK